MPPNDDNLQARYLRSVDFADRLLSEPGWDRARLRNRMGVNIDLATLSRFLTRQLKMTARAKTTFAVMEALEWLEFCIGPLIKSRAEHEIQEKRRAPRGNPPERWTDVVYEQICFVRSQQPTVEAIANARSLLDPVLSFRPQFIERGISQLLLTYALLTDSQHDLPAQLLDEVLMDIERLKVRANLITCPDIDMQMAICGYSGLVEFNIGVIKLCHELQELGLADCMTAAAHEDTQGPHTENFLRRVDFLISKKSVLADKWVDTALKRINTNVLKTTILEDNFRNRHVWEQKINERI